MTATRFAVRLAPDHLTDGQLLARFVGERDEVAFAVLVRRHAGLVYGVCRRALGNAADADDAFQAAFVVLLRKADVLADRPALGDWLYAVAVRVARKARTTAARRTRREAVVAGRRSEAVAPHTPEPLDWFDRELAELPAKYREPVVLCLVQEWSREDAAAALGIPEGTLASRLAYAKKRLADRLTARGLVTPAALVAVAPAALLDSTAAFASGAVPERVTQLANGATQAMLFTKLRYGMLATIAVAVLAAGGVLLAGPGAHSADRPARRNAPVPEKKAPPEPEWMANFRKAYELKDGEFVKRVAPPYIDERVDFQIHPLSGKEDADARNRADAVKNGRFYTVFVEQDGKKLTRRMVLSSVYLAIQPQLQRGDNLLTLWDAVTLITGREAPEVAIDPKAKDDAVFAPKNKTVSGDFVTRKAAPLDKLAPQLEKILRDECQLDVTLTVKQEEQEVYVVGGTFKLTPPEWRGDAKNRIGLHMLDVYAAEDGLNKEFDHFDLQKGLARVPTVQSMGYSGTPVELVRFLGDRVKTRMVWDTDLPAEPKFMWHNHTFKNPTKEQEAEDKDPDKVLANVTAQTGLMFKKEKRKVPVLYVSVPAKK